MDSKTFGRQFLESTAVCRDKEQLHNGRPPVPEKPAPTDSILVQLPAPEMLPDKMTSFLQLIELRSSYRDYNHSSLNLKELSFLLWCTQGVKMLTPPGITKRNVPSAGSRHALETYLIIHRVTGLEPGIYRYMALEHALHREELDGNAMIKAEQSFNSKTIVEHSAVTFIWTAVSRRMTYAFSNRGYRYIFLDAGHTCENLYLASEVLGMGACALGAFSDESLNDALALDMDKEFAVYAASVGKI